MSTVIKEMNPVLTDTFVDRNEAVFSNIKHKMKAVIFFAFVCVKKCE